jgi:flagellar hook-associated protein 1 FlgK
MSISQALSNATSGLSAASRQAGVASQNIANALTPGYSRREVSLAERTLAGEGAGVRVAGVQRAEASALRAERLGAEAFSFRDETRAAAAEKISRLIGGPEDANALFGKFANFDRALRALSNAPDSLAAQNAAVAAARQVAQGVNDLAASYQTMRMDADRSIAAEVDNLNAALKQIERLNNEIEKANVAGRDANALLDQRDGLIDKVNAAIPLRQLVRENGRVDLMTTEGVMLLSGTARSVSFTPTALITADMSYAGGALSGLTVDGFDITPGASSRASEGGRLAGLFAVRDEIVPAASAELDAVAEDLISRFQTAGLDPTIAPGAPGLFTDAGAALAGPASPGLAGRLALNAAVDPVQGGAVWRLRDGLGAVAPGPIGSNALIVGLISVLDEPRASALAGGRLMTALETASEIAASAGSIRAREEAQWQGSVAYSSALSDAERAETGVDTDAEMQNLILIEQAYAANARVIEAVSAMIDRLMEI